MAKVDDYMSAPEDEPGGEFYEKLAAVVQLVPLPMVMHHGDRNTFATARLGSLALYYDWEDSVFRIYRENGGEYLYEGDDLIEIIANVIEHSKVGAS